MMVSKNCIQSYIYVSSSSVFTYLDFCLHELCEGDYVEFGVAPDQAMVPRRDLINVERLPPCILLAVIGHLNEVVNEELKDAISCRLRPNRVLAVLERNGALLVKIDWVAQIVVNEHVAHFRLIRLERGARAGPGRAILILVELPILALGVDLARWLHSQWHSVAIVAMEAERAHRAVNSHAARPHAIRVLRALVAPDLRLVTLIVHRGELAISARVLAGQAENGLGQWVNTLINPAELHAVVRVLRHRHLIDEVEVGVPRRSIRVAFGELHLQILIVVAHAKVVLRSFRHKN